MYKLSEWTRERTANELQIVRGTNRTERHGKNQRVNNERLSLSLSPSFLLMAHSTSGETKDLTNGVYRQTATAVAAVFEAIWNFAKCGE